jgi:hypothetical protein
VFLPNKVAIFSKFKMVIPNVKINKYIIIIKFKRPITAPLKNVCHKHFLSNEVIFRQTLLKAAKR